ncbi:hypothetical protein LSH36_755g00008, partial [Paralvinella palmiformis]
ISFLDGLLFFFIVPWTPIVGGQKVNTRLSPVKNRPPDNDQIFDIQTPTDSQCIYNCIQNGKCLAVVYDKRRYLCNGYRSITANQSLTQEQQAWHIIYKDEEIFLAMFPQTSCTASSSFNENVECSYAYDGVSEPGEYRKWSTLGTNIGE